MEHLVEHMKVNYHSVHEPRCGVCGKHCRSFESLREHLIGMQKKTTCREEKTAAYCSTSVVSDASCSPSSGPLPKVECARVFSVRGCSICLNIFDSNAAVRHHRAACQYTRAAPVMVY
jgi:hypothetical protein